MVPDSRASGQSTALIGLFRAAAGAAGLCAVSAAFGDVAAGIFSAQLGAGFVTGQQDSR